jgi:N-acetylated-alpha-linked acidic dipeptidase
MRLRRTVLGSAVLVLSAVSASRGVAQAGFTPAGGEIQRGIESRVLAAIDPERFAELARVLSLRPHVAGSEGQAAFRDTLIARLSAWGFAPEVARYRIFLPWATEVSLSIVAPDSLPLDPVEGPVLGVPDPPFPHYPLANGYSGVGEVVAEAVYVNFGLHEDYELLGRAGIDVRGKVAVARYGRSYRGVKARLAEEAGALALVLYSDPRDDGWFRGDPYPAGPWRPPTGVQRGSVRNGRGDPEPGDLLSIPVVPVSAEIAARILSRIGGAGLPDAEWQGALPFRYHVGPGPAVVRLRVVDDRDGPDGGRKEIANVLARIEGAVWPDETVVVGGHIDAWGPGANDNVSGTTAVLSAARVIRALADAGFPPRRTIVFAGWDGEEWGLIGSTEWVEQHAAALTENGVAYLNQDMIAGGGFGAGASPSLKPLYREAAAAVPAGESTLLRQWAASDSTLAIGDLGGGSDFEGFYHHLGIPSASHGFGGPYGLYHSAYDSPEAVEKVDPGYRNQTLSSELLAVLALRLANAEVLPLDYSTFAREVRLRWEGLRPQVGAAGLPSSAERLDAALAALESAAEAFAGARDRYLRESPSAERSRAANAALRQVERQLAREAGLVGRPWNRNLVFSTDARNGYATIALPSIAEALIAAEAERIESEVDDLANRVRAAADRLAAATRALAP